MQSHNNYVYTGKSIVFTVIPHEYKSIEIFYMHIGLEILVVRDNEKNDPSTCALGEEKETKETGRYYVMLWHTNARGHSMYVLSFI